MMELVMIRHGQTPGNAQRRYVGAVDQPLSALGREQAREAGTFPEVKRVYVSTLSRASETAAIMFPAAEQVVVEDIQEMDFGIFAGRSADEMEDDPAYRAWVESGCTTPCPQGESRDEFTERVCRGIVRMLQGAQARGERRVVVVAHGGTMMASLHSFGDGSRGYYEWNVGNCEGHLIEVELGEDGATFNLVASGPVAGLLAR